VTLAGLGLAWPCLASASTTQPPPDQNSRPSTASAISLPTNSPISEDETVRKLGLSASGSSSAQRSTGESAECAGSAPKIWVVNSFGCVVVSLLSENVWLEAAQPGERDGLVWQEALLAVEASGEPSGGQETHGDAAASRDSGQDERSGRREGPYLLDGAVQGHVGQPAGQRDVQVNGCCPGGADRDLGRPAQAGSAGRSGRVCKAVLDQRAEISSPARLVTCCRRRAPTSPQLATREHVEERHQRDETEHGPCQLRAAADIPAGGQVNPHQDHGNGMEETDQELEDLLHYLNLPGALWVPVRSLHAGVRC
jgi:hypothetical protein